MRENLSEAARKIQRAYYKEWRKKNSDKVREKNRRYWEKKAVQQANADEVIEDDR